MARSPNSYASRRRDAFGKGADATEWLVELVSDASGHLAQSAQLVTLQQMHLELSFFNASDDDLGQLRYKIPLYLDLLR